MNKKKRGTKKTCNESKSKTKDATGKGQKTETKSIT